MHIAAKHFILTRLHATASGMDGNVFAGVPWLKRRIVSSLLCAFPLTFH